MSAKVYIPQPIPEVALDRLKASAEVEMFPHEDRMVGGLVFCLHLRSGCTSCRYGNPEIPFGYF